MEAEVGAYWCAESFGTGSNTLTLWVTRKNPVSRSPKVKSRPWTTGPRLFLLPVDPARVLTARTTLRASTAKPFA